MLIEDEHSSLVGPSKLRAWWNRTTRNQLLLYSGILLAACIVLMTVIITIAIVVPLSQRSKHRGHSSNGGGHHEPNPPTPPPNPPTPPGEPSVAAQVKVDNILKHERELQAIAMAHNGSRAVALGYNASVEYVTNALAATYWQVQLQPFQLDVWSLQAAAFAQTAPTARTFAAGTDYSVMRYAGNGNVTEAAVAAVPVLGCNATDFENFTAGAVALIARGECSFGTKAANALAAGAAAALIYDANVDAPLVGTLGGDVALPVFGIAVSLAEQLGDDETVRVSLSVTSTLQQLYTMNIIADLPASDQSNANATVLVGAHLDSVEEGPGINDNGSGSSSLLEIALQMSLLAIKPVNHVRFCWWAAEELGLLGSTAYVASLDAAARATIACNLNYDMIGSPNYFRGIYNGSSGPANVSVGSAYIQRLYETQQTALDLAWSLTDFDGRSDYGPFIAAGIPAGGLFTGAEVVKTMDERSKFGGLANTPYDPCYHQECDTVDNLSLDALEQMAVSAATVAQQLWSDADLRTHMGLPAVPPAPATRAVSAAPKQRGVYGYKDHLKA